METQGVGRGQAREATARPPLPGPEKDSFLTLDVSASGFPIPCSIIIDTPVASSKMNIPSQLPDAVEFTKHICVYVISYPILIMIQENSLSHLDAERLRP